MASVRHALGGHWGTVPTQAQLLNTASASAFSWKYNLEVGQTLWVIADAALFVCVDPTPGAAVWQQLVASGSGAGFAGCTVPGTNHHVARFNGNTCDIEDSPVEIDDVGNVIIPLGGSLTLGAPIDPNCILMLADETGRDYCIRQSGTSGSALLRLEKSEGTVAAPTALSAAGKIGGYSGAPYDGTNYTDTAELAYWATEAQTPTSKGTEMRLTTTENGTAGQQLRAILRHDGDWDYQGNQLKNIEDPVDPQDAVTLSYLQSQISRSIKITSTDTTTNISGTATVPFSELTGALAWNDDATVFTPSLGTGEVTLAVAGRYRAEFTAAMLSGTTTNTARNNIRFAFYLNGTQISPDYQNNYVRDASGHNETSQSGSLVFEAAAGDVLQIQRQRVSGVGGTQTLQGTNNFLYVELIK